jgi:hypothetical protein
MSDYSNKNTQTKQQINNINKNIIKEINGPRGPEPTRYGVDTPEWEKKGRVSDF